MNILLWATLQKKDSIYDSKSRPPLTWHREREIDF